MSEAPEYPNLILGTAGHIDHGKSSLIKALTGTDPDRLREEKERGITIELGFARLDLSDTLHMGVVDVPGHERFVRQMIAGSTGIDIALLCIAADDGIMPQTREHLAVLELLEIPTCVVALTKIDMVDEEWAELVEAEVGTLLEKTSYKDAPIVRVSAKTGSGIDELKQTLVTTAKKPASGQMALPCLPIDRVFTIKGSGTVVTGTLWSGVVKVDDELEILPSNIKARVRQVQVHGMDQKQVHAGNRVALNLNAVKKSEIVPGDFLTKPSAINPTDRFDAYFTYSDVTKSGKPLKSGTRVRIAHGTREVLGRILVMDDLEMLQPGESSFVQIRLDRVLPVLSQDRFIARAYSPIQVIGGGRVMISRPRRRTHLNKKQAALLEAARTGTPEACVLTALDAQKRPCSVVDLVRFIGMNSAEAQDILEVSAEAGSVMKLGGRGTDTFYATRSLLQSYEGMIERQLLDFHTTYPDELGISKEALRQKVDKVLSSEVFDLLVARSVEAGKAVVSDGVVSHPQAGATAKAHEKKVADRLLQELEQQGAQPQTVSDLIKTVELEKGLVYRALGQLEKENKLQEVSKDLYFETNALSVLEEKVRAYLQENGKATVAQLKEAMNTSRKYAVPLLEYFDTTGLTVREGDNRLLRK